MANRPRLAALDDPLAPKPAAPKPAAEPKAPARQAQKTKKKSGGGGNSKPSSKSAPKQATEDRPKTSPAPERAAPLATSRRAAVKEINGRIPEPVAAILDEFEFQQRHDLRGPRQAAINALVSSEVAGARPEALLELTKRYRGEVDVDGEPKRALYVRMPVELADVLDTAVFEMRKQVGRREAPTRQDLLAALVWLRLSSTELGQTA